MLISSHFPVAISQNITFLRVVTMMPLCCWQSFSNGEVQPSLWATRLFHCGTGIISQVQVSGNSADLGLFFWPSLGFKPWQWYQFKKQILKEIQYLTLNSSSGMSWSWLSNILRNAWNRNSIYLGSWFIINVSYWKHKDFYIFHLLAYIEMIWCIYLDWRLNYKLHSANTSITPTVLTTLPCFQQWKKIK